MTLPNPDLYFFLSFAGENDRDDARVATFFDDLCDEVGVQAGAGRARQSLGFLSITSLRLGADWSEEIASALGRCGMFVALCSPSYFASASCGVEWRAFQDRLAVYERANKKPAPALLPVCWVPMTMPGVAAGIQYTDRQLSEPLARLGLRMLMLLDQHRDHYRTVVLRLAQHIVAVSRAHVVPPSMVGRDYAALPRAFPGPATPQPRLPQQERTTKDDSRLPDLNRGDGFPRLHGI
jgi:hypothetical protein